VSVRRAPRYFTLEDALRLLPDVGQTIGRLRRIRDELVSLRQTVEGQWAALEDDPATLTEIGEDQWRLTVCRRISVRPWASRNGAGCSCATWIWGLVDFPSLAGQAEIYLCWKVGEATIGFWHGLDEGYAGRKSLSELPRFKVH